jgi:hypothetical protein
MVAATRVAHDVALRRRMPARRGIQNYAHLHGKE